MSHTTETVCVRGIRLARFEDAIDAFMRVNGLVQCPKGRGEQELVLRRDGKWLAFADSVPHSSDAWGEHLSRYLERSVLTIFTWDGEASVVAKRWKKGRPRAELSLLQEAYRGPDRLPRAPAKVFWPWLDVATREAVLKDGIVLREPTATTGDAELDELLEGFDDVEVEADEDPDHIYASIGVSVAAIGAALGLRRPLVDPYAPEPGDRELTYGPSS